MAITCKCKSGIWEFFDEAVEEEGNEKTSRNRRIPCKLCNLQLADGGDISNLMNHAPSGEASTRIQKISEDCRASKEQGETDSPESWYFTSLQFATCSCNHQTSCCCCCARFVATEGGRRYWI